MDPALYAPLENKPLARSESLEIDDLLSRASRGDTQACLQVGQLFARGEKIRLDRERAFFWISKAAEADLPEAWLRMGLCYLQGLGTKPDPEKAILLFEKAAARNIPFAMTSLGICHSMGSTRDESLAFSWFEKAANAGDPDGQYYLGQAYEEGKGTAPNPEKALSIALET